jgi:hypothetical protein
MKVFIEQKVKASFSVLKNTMYCLKNEKEETKDAIKILFNKFKDKDKLSEEDVEFVLNQAKDLGRMSVLIPFVILPGSQITVPLLYKVAEKLNIDLIPSSFKIIKEDNINDIHSMNGIGLHEKENKMNKEIEEIRKI